MITFSSGPMNYAPADGPMARAVMMKRLIAESEQAGHKLENNFTWNIWIDEKSKPHFDLKSKIDPSLVRPQ